MKCLRDTCTFLRIISHSNELSPMARALFLDPANDVLHSVVSVWEFSVKHALGQLTLPGPIEQFLVEQRGQHGIVTLPIDERAVLHLHKLSTLHRDPFDRMLICQAIERHCLLLTPDPPNLHNTG